MFSAILSSLMLAQAGLPQTKAEKTNYKETSTYADVIQFLGELKATNAPIRITEIGKSPEGRTIPLVIAARPMVNTPEEARKSGKLVIYMQANIHAGEVEGKEAALMLLRDYTLPSSKMLDKTILIVQPIYNIDGNEKFAPQARNRPGQNGPEMVGLRANGQGFDLNRDCVKAESNEMEAVLKHVYTWRPHIVYDLHTTDGTRHGYSLTFGGVNHPNFHPAMKKYQFDDFFPTVVKSMKSTYNTNIFDYGNGTLENGKWRFDTFGCESRYVTNYGGLRNSFCVLSEAMVYEPFDIRVRDTYRFVDECQKKFVRDYKRIIAMCRKADMDATNWGKNPSKAPPMATRYKLQLRGTEAVLLEKGIGTGGRRQGPIRDMEEVLMPVYDRFEAAATVPLPFAYFVPASETKALEKLRLHGIVMSELTSVAPNVKFEALKMTNVAQAATAFQGHKLMTVDGTWGPATPPTSGYIVRLGQPLGLLAFDLLEPTAGDGLTTWGFFGDPLSAGQLHPVLRVVAPSKF